ncbi:curli-like amyloid fiber formation chaperone CsgH [Labilibaculum antarcticum]|uniref:Uncharacterized protein n=1 Tax=Labilibaculum antarcticum TaxID=1717717 RepID=A0A1Y1CDX7_9BACT|nr:curli-like amyloid fiber formation chaperone CsgH [Labilibaculum antarcticum]BAX78520.1 hypothetical protein ALGA_0125 [Labilibaculum antarcticum]
MFPKIIMVIIMCFCSNTSELKQEFPVRAWIDIEGEVQNLSVKAMFQNNGDNSLSLSYVLNVTKKSQSGSSNSLQKGAFIAPLNKIISLSESRMNLRKDDELIAKLLIYHDNLIVAKDSVVFHGDNS